MQAPNNAGIYSSAIESSPEEKDPPSFENFYAVNYDNPTSEVVYPSFSEGFYEQSVEPDHSIQYRSMEEVVLAKEETPCEQSYDSSMAPYFKQSEESIYLPPYESPYEKNINPCISLPLKEK